MFATYLTFHGDCEKAFRFYADAFDGGNAMFTRLNNDPNNPVMHAHLQFTKYEGCLTGADVNEPVVVSGVGICVVLPSREIIERIAAKLAEGGTLIQEFLPHPAPHQNDGGATVKDQFGFTWYLST